MSKALTSQSACQLKTNRGRCLRKVAGDKPLFTPCKVPLDLLFFRRIFSNLYRMHGENDEVPVSLFQRSVVRLFRVLGMKEAMDFDAAEYDVDGSGAVGWYEFVSCWKKSQVAVRLSPAEQVYLAMEDPGSCFFGTCVNFVITSLIALSCICFILGTMSSFKETECSNPECTGEPQQQNIFDLLEWISVLVFTMEYVVRLLTAPFARNELLDCEQMLELVTEHEEVRIPSKLVRLVHFVAQPMNIIDLLVIVPFYVELVLGMAVSNITVLRVLRLTRLFRLIKLGKYFEILQVILRVFHKTLQMLYVLWVYLVLGICFSSAALYFVEMGSWDPVQGTYVSTSHDGVTTPTQFRSIPHTFWWCIVTMTTVGYGDMYPVTALGKVVACGTMLFGILVLAMPVSVISLSFNQVWSDWNEERRRESESREQDLLSVTEALQGFENRTRLVIEVFDDRTGREEPELLGGVTWEELPIDSSRIAEDERQHIPLTAGADSDRASGSIHAGYTWEPRGRAAADDGREGTPRIQGSLTVRIWSAKGLLISDWKKRGQRDVYAVVHCWPKPPTNAEKGGIMSVQHRTKTVRATLNPVWEETCLFEFDWPADWKPESSVATIEKCESPNRLKRMKSMAAGASPGTRSRGSESPPRTLQEVVDAQGSEIRRLREQVEQVHALLRDLRPGARSPAQGATDSGAGADSGPPSPASPLTRLPGIPSNPDA